MRRYLEHRSHERGQVGHGQTHQAVDQSCGAATSHQDAAAAASFNKHDGSTSPRLLERKVALLSVMVGKCGLIRSSMVTVARELKAEEMVLREGRGERSYEC